MNVTLLAKVEFEVELQEDHTFEVESQRNVGHVAGSQEVKAQDLIHYHLACEREQHSAWELFRYKKDNNDAPFAISKVEKIYAYELLTFDDTVSCEDEIWVTKGLLGEAHGNILGMDIIKDMSAVESQEYQVVFTRPDIASVGVDILDGLDRMLLTNIQVFVDFDYAMGRSITIMGRLITRFFLCTLRSDKQTTLRSKGIFSFYSIGGVEIGIQLMLVMKVVLLCLTKRTMSHDRIVFSGDANREITVTETFHLQTDDELSEKELKQIEANVQAIQTILLGLPEDIYVAVDTCETAQEIWLRVQQMMKGSDIRIQEKKAKLFNEWERFTSNERESIESYYHRFLKLMNDLKRNKHFPEKIASNMKFLNNLQPEWSRHKEVDELKAERLAKTQDPLALMANSNNPYAFPAPHQDQPSQMQMVGGNGGNQFRQYAGQNVGNPVRYNDVIGNQIRNGNLEAARAEGNAAGQNGNQIRCYNCRGEEARIQLQAEEYDLMAAAADLDEIEEVNANYILMANLQQASTS
nr:zinc finger, CCHC-type [Tanacetum cinerariifolium]